MKGNNNNNIYDNLPESLKELDVPIFVLFKTEQQKDGKFSKIPYQPNGYHASSNDPSTWCIYADALAAYETGEFSCIGIALADALTCVDLDNVRNPATGELHPIAQNIIDKVPGWTEISVSGKGIHIFGFCGEKFPHVKHAWMEGNEQRAVEIYQFPHMMALTGKVIDGSADDLDDLTDQMSSVYAEHIAPHYIDEDAAVPTTSKKSSEKIDVSKRLEIAYRSKAGETIKALMSGDTSSHADDHSAADLALCCHLAFWLDKDAHAIEEAFNMSVLSERDKWKKRSDYRRRTIATAILKTREVFGKDEESKKVLPDAIFEIDAPTPIVASGETAAEKTPEKQAEKTGAIRWDLATPKDKVALAYDSIIGSRLSTLTIPEQHYFAEPYIPENTLIAVTGEPGSGKSSFVIAKLHEITNSHDDAVVIYCDADNPVTIAKERSDRLRGDLEDRINYWGSFLIGPDGLMMSPWDIEDEAWIILIQKIVASGKKPIVVFDTLNSFMKGQDENSNAVVGKLMQHLRVMTHAGATVILIHHTGKAATAKESRGASAFKGAVDVGWLVESHIVDCEILTMRVSAWKSRMGKTKPEGFRMVDGRLKYVESAAPSSASPLFFEIEKQLRYSKDGLTKDELTKKVYESGRWKREEIRKAIDDGMMIRKFVKKGTKIVIGKAESKSAKDIFDIEEYD